MEKLNFISKTFIGRRTNNQDNCIAEEIKEGIYFLAVADGMGGTVGGEVASSLVLDIALRIIKEEYGSEVLPTEMKVIIERVFLSAQKTIAERIKKEPQLSGMGTTLTCVLIQNDKYVWGNIGDSRIYLLRSNDLKQITVDHTYVNDYIKESDEELPLSVLKQYGNYLQRALDGGEDAADFFPSDKQYESLNNGDIFLLCSDGLITDKVNGDNAVFKDYILSSKNLTSAAKQLIALAFHNGSTDNISVVLASFGTYQREKIKLKKFNYPPIDSILKNGKAKFTITKLPSVISGAIGLIGLMLIYLIFINPNQKLVPDNFNSSKVGKGHINKSNPVLSEGNDKSQEILDSTYNRDKNYWLSVAKDSSIILNKNLASKKSYLKTDSLKLISRKSKKTSKKYLTKIRKDTSIKTMKNQKEPNRDDLEASKKRVQVKEWISEGKMLEKQGDYKSANFKYYSAWKNADPEIKKQLDSVLKVINIKINADSI